MLSPFPLPFDEFFGSGASTIEGLVVLRLAGDFFADDAAFF
jgi:hypothetical protein